MNRKATEPKKKTARKPAGLEGMFEALRHAEAEGIELRAKYERATAPYKVLTADDLMVRAR